MTVVLELAVTDSDAGVSLADADAILAVAQESGIDAIRLLDRAGESAVVDPSVTGAYLAGHHDGLGYLIDARTTHNAPYNLARRVSAFDRATDGLVGLVLNPGDGDEVSDATAPDRGAVESAERWGEYAGILEQLWESFPASALLGDQERALVVDDSLVRAIEHDGRFYRVAGPLDGPASRQGRPPLVVAEPDAVGWKRTAAHADVVIIDVPSAVASLRSLTSALGAAGRNRTDVTVLVRTRTVPDYLEWYAHDEVNGVVLVTDDLDAGEVVDLIRAVAAHIERPAGGSLRDRLGLRTRTEVPA
ncbi:LLM class flavin-dependent oxidoreductase [Rhodococcoides fascians A25f]|uniref:LLM class flavin-dependent oxidoreductase n=1 Tax=Rhodococcoides fascians TaxID=1828 RepID=UPI00055A2AB1|nr:LLM class flavin-dependent oxidoreductase [Rhodococcus fascians]QII04904.1 LLM class flavin-dependent oxidoreductase [Rhodococcus fascians A25f]